MTRAIDQCAYWLKFFCSYPLFVCVKIGENVTYLLRRPTDSLRLRVYTRRFAFVFYFFLAFFFAVVGFKFFFNIVHFMLNHSDLFFLVQNDDETSEIKKTENRTNTAKNESKEINDQKQQSAAVARNNNEKQKMNE